jgi:DNA-binding XRE family transcriptional regulator
MFVSVATLGPTRGQAAFALAEALNTSAVSARYIAPVANGIQGATYVPRSFSLNQFENFRLTVGGRKVNTGGLRNELSLTQEQKSNIIEYAKQLGLSEEAIIFTENNNTSYKLLFGEVDLLQIGTDVAPASGSRLSANSRVSIKAAVAHEIVGHRAAELANRTQVCHTLEEVQASIRAARFAVDLTVAERITLIRDALERLHKTGQKIKDVKGQLWIFEEGNMLKPFASNVAGIE